MPVRLGFWIGLCLAFATNTSCADDVAIQTDKPAITGPNLTGPNVKAMPMIEDAHIERAAVEATLNQQIDDKSVDNKAAENKKADDLQAPIVQTAQAMPSEDANTNMGVMPVSRSVDAVIQCEGIAQQGGLMFCQTAPNAKVKVARSEDDFYFETADEYGHLLIGFDRDEKRTVLEVQGERLNFDFVPRDYDTSRINGLPKNMVSEYSPAELKRIRRASARKKIGFASRVKEIGFKDGFIYPIQADYTKTTNFGAQRILNDIPKKPHYGVDLAAPKGTPIVAPADGIVSLADDDMYFEGSLIMIDHGQGLISYYLHNEDVLVKDGQRVIQGQQIATVGSKGRSTGPHLCWRLKWRNRNLDPELITNWPQTN